MSAVPRCVALCLVAAALLVLPATAEVTIGQTYSGEVSVGADVGLCPAAAVPRGPSSSRA